MEFKTAHNVTHSEPPQLLFQNQKYLGKKGDTKGWSYHFEFLLLEFAPQNSHQVVFMISKDIYNVFIEVFNFFSVAKLHQNKLAPFTFSVSERNATFSDDFQRLHTLLLNHTFLLISLEGEMCGPISKWFWSLSFLLAFPLEEVTENFELGVTSLSRTQKDLDLNIMPLGWSWDQAWIKTFIMINYNCARLLCHYHSFKG